MRPTRLMPQMTTLGRSRDRKITVPARPRVTLVRIKISYEREIVTAAFAGGNISGYQIDHFPPLLRVSQSGSRFAMCAAAISQ